MPIKKEDILAYLSRIKPILQEDGIEQIGLFGSFAHDRADALSDIDLVLKTTDRFVAKYRGVKAFLYLESLREQLAKRFHREVDLCDVSGLKDKSIIEGAIYV